VSTIAVILAQLNRPLGESRHFGNLVRGDCNPAFALGIDVAKGGTTVGGGKIRVELDRAVEQAQCLLACLPVFNLMKPSRTA
jgi:hypothetical protein